jgi:hypothetical protein
LVQSFQTCAVLNKLLQVLRVVNYLLMLGRLLRPQLTCPVKVLLL